MKLWNFHAGKVHIAFTESLFISDRRDAPIFTNTGGALVTAGFMNILLRNSAIVPISDMTGIMEFTGIWKKRSQVFGTPAYYVFEMYAGADATHLVSVTTESGTYSVSQGVDRLPEIASIPYLDVVAALNQDERKLTLFCVNRSLQTDIASELGDGSGTEFRRTQRWKRREGARARSACSQIRADFDRKLVPHFSARKRNRDLGGS